MNMSNQPEQRRKSKRLAGASEPCPLQAPLSPGLTLCAIVATAVYDEQDGDFLFTRGAKRAKTDQPGSEGETATKSQQSRKDAARQVRPGRKKRTPSPAEPPRAVSAAPRRTSTRISDQAVPPAPQDEELVVPKSRGSQRRTRPTAEKGRKAKEPDPLRDYEDQGPRRSAQPGTPMDVDRATHSDSPPQKIALPFSDTPIINRNRELRKGGGGNGGARRSSLGMRGRRASSLIENGHSAIPHREVDPAEFYKHIEAESLPEPRRMRQLLTWCGERALSEKPPHGSRGSSAVLGGKFCI